MTARRLLVLVGIASLGVSAAAAILILLFGDFGETEGRILGTTFAIAVASLLALPGAVLLERADQRLLGAANVTLAVVAFALALTLLWISETESVGRLLASAAAAAAASTQIAGLTVRRRAAEPTSVRLAYAGACALAAVLAAMAVIAIWAAVDAESYYRALGALAVLDVFLVVLQPMLRRLGRPAATREARIVVDDGDHEAVADAVRRLQEAGLRVRVER